MLDFTPNEEFECSYHDLISSIDTPIFDPKMNLSRVCK